MGASGASDRIYSREIVVEIVVFVGTIQPKIGMSTGKSTERAVNKSKGGKKFVVTSCE